MSIKYAKARLSHAGESFVVTIHTANGEYHELPALDKHHAITITEAFTRRNELILTEFVGGSLESPAHTEETEIVFRGRPSFFGTSKHHTQRGSNAG